MLRTKTFRIALIVAVVIALYAVAGFVVAPKLMRSALLKDIPAAINATPSVGEIHINPFLFQATIDDFALAGADGEQLLGFRRLFVDFQLSSIWHRAYTFANIDITAPAVSAVMAKDGRLNLLALKPKPSPTPTPPPADREEPLPALRIGSFKVSQGSVAYEDRSRPDVFAARLEPLNFELRDFKTGVDGGRFTFTAASKLGERVEWHGHVSVDPLESDGEFRVDGLLAHTLWEYLQDQVNFVVDSGSVDLAATYKVSLKDPSAPSLQVDLSKVSLTDLTVAPRPADAEASPGESNSKEEPWITIPSLAVTGGKVDLASHQAHVDLVSLNGMKLKTWLQSDKTLNLMKFAAARTNATPTTPGPASTIPGAAPAAPTATLTASPGAAAAAAMPWTFDLRQFDIHDASIATEDRSAHPGVKVLLAPFSLQVSGASQDLTKPVTVALDTRINERGSLTVGGQVTPRPVMANLDVKFADIDLTTIQPYIAQQTAMTLLSGKLGGAGKVHYGVQPKMPAIQFAGNITVEKLHTVDDALHDDFINWDRLDIEGIDYTQAPDRLDIDQIVARKLYARVIIETDTRINVKRVLKIPATAGPTGRAKRVTTAAVVDSPGTGTGTGTGIRAGAAPGSRAAAKHTRKDKVVAAAPASQTMPMSIKKVVIQASEANFADFSVKPNFATGIQNLHGSVVGLSSKPGTRAKVDLTGAVDTFSPVSITGEVNVLGPLYTDLTMSFRNISLPVFDPYSGKFTGYNIAKGKLTTELHYKVDGRKLDAEHHIIIEQLEFGDKTASKDAVSLPIKLAVSLLKDRNGVIDLNLPVTGSLDDPQFRLAPVIWKVLVNILERAVAAPFALLGSVFGGGPDLQFVDFQPGVASLDAAALDKAKIIAKALSERPQLKIDVPIAVVPEIDRPALVDAAYRAQIAAERATKASSKKGAATAGGAGPAFDQLDPATQLDLLTSLYAKDVGSEPKYPDDVTGVKSKPDRVAAKIGFLSKGIRQHVVVGDAELQTLGQQRALAFQQALLTDSPVEAERVFLVANDKATANDGLVRLELSLK